jgi:flagellar operon protein
MIERLDLLSPTTQGQTSTSSTQQQSSDFGSVFQQELERQSDARTVAFSKHAQKRVEERGIDITPDLMDQLRGSVVRAQEKGATNILAMDTDRVFLINVPNAKVITAMTQEEMRENVFTNIDGAVFL